MSLMSIGSRSVVTAPASATAADLVRLMAKKNVGSVVVTREGKPVGIVTDRDLVLRVLQHGKDATKVKAKDVMTKRLESIFADRHPLEAATQMRQRGIRRLPILGQKGELIGIVTYDDLVQHVGTAHAEMAEAISRFPKRRSGA